MRVQVIMRARPALLPPLEPRPGKERYQQLTVGVASGYRFKQGPEITRNKRSKLLSKYPALSPRGKYFSVTSYNVHVS